MATVNSVNNTTPTSTLPSNGAAPKREKTPTPPQIARQAITTATETSSTSAPISGRVSPLTTATEGTTSSTTSSSTSTVKVAAKKSILLELEENVENLSQTAQDLFADALTRYQAAVAGLLATFNSTNEEYIHSEAILGQDEVCRRLRKLKENEDNRYTNMRYNKPLLERRVACLHKAIMKMFIEFGLLQHSIIGNDSVLQSSVRYGAVYRLWEMGTPENTDEKISVTIKDDSKESPTAKSIASSTTATTTIPAEQPQTNRDNLTKMLHEMVSLKERVTICFEALKLKMYPSFNITKEKVIDNLPFQQRIRDDIAASDFPKKYFSIYSQQFKDLNEKIILAVGLNEKPAAIIKRQRQLADILSQMQAHFKLGIEEAPASVEEVLSPECTQAFNLTNQITIIKEDVLLGKSDVLLGTSWDNKPLLLRQAAALKREVAAFKTGKMAHRLEAINEAVGIYKAHMDSIKGKMDAIDGHFKALEAASRLRNTWRLDPSKEVSTAVSSPSTVSQAAATSSSSTSSGSWFSFLSWGAISSASASSTTTTVTSVDATPIIPAPVTMTAPTTDSAATTTATTSTTTTSAAPAST